MRAPGRSVSLLALSLLCACGARTGLGGREQRGDDAAIGDARRHDTRVDAEPTGCACSGAALLASDQASPAAIAADRSYVYWTSRGSDCKNGSIRRVRKCGGAVEILARNQPSPNALALDAERVYFYNGCASGLLRSVAKTGGQVRTYPISVGESGGAVAVGAEEIYFSDYGLMRIRKDGGTQQPIDDNTFVYGLAADARGAFFSGPLRGTSTFGVLAYRPGAKAALLIATPAGLSNGIAIDDDAVYFSGARNISRVARGGGDISTVASGSSWRIATGDRFVYWTEGFAGSGGYTVKKAPKSGGEVSIVGKGDGAYVDLVVDERCVYVADLYGDEIRSFPR